MELKAAEEYVSFKDKDVLEIGCGEGRFTSKYFSKTRSTVAIDFDAEAVRKAAEDYSSSLSFFLSNGKIPPSHSNQVRFQEGNAEKLDFPSECFDVVVFSWSLCCVEDPDKSLREANRVLRSGGRLLNLMPDAISSFETAMLLQLGGKDAIYQGSLNGIRALVRSVQGGLFTPPIEESRIFFETYFDTIEDDFIRWLPSKLGPFNQDEFKSIGEKSLNSIKKFARENLKQQQDNESFRVRDVLMVYASWKNHKDRLR